MTALVQPLYPPSSVDRDAFDGSIDYIRAIVKTNPGVIDFHTGAGHIFFDLLRNLPFLSDYDEEKVALCHLIEEHAYPLAASLFAQAVHIVITVSPGPLSPPSRISALASYTAFDSDAGILRHGFLSPEHPFPDLDELTIAAGMTIQCEPLNYHYHQLHDDRTAEPKNGASNLLVDDYAGRNRDPLGGYHEKHEKPTPVLSTKLIPRWLLERAPEQIIVPRVAGDGGASQIPAYIRLLNISPHHHVYELIPTVAEHRPELQLVTKPAPQPVQARVVSAAESKPENISPHVPQKSFHYTFPAPGLVPLWYRPGE